MGAGNSSSGDSKTENRALVDEAPVEDEPFNDRASLASLASMQEAHVGEVLSPDGAYIGELDDIGLLHGEGIQVFTDGRRYSGQFSKNVFNGAAVMVWPDGHSYTGQYENNQKSGEGIFIWPDGRIYDGQWCDGVRHGHGNYTAVESYVGQYAKGQRHGDGVLTWPDGKRYSGQFFRGRFHGYAVMSWPNGKRYLGLYKDNQKHGDGLFLWPDGRTYEGQWAKGYRHGRGTFLDKKGKERTGIWRKDKLVEPEKSSKPPTTPLETQVAAARAAMIGQMPLQPRPPEKEKPQEAKKEPQEQDQLNFCFDGLTLDSIDQDAFKQEFKDSLIANGASPTWVENLEVTLKEGSIIAGVVGPKDVVGDLRKLDLGGRVKVMGDAARVEEVLSPEAARALELAQAAKAASDERAAKRAEVLAKAAKIEEVRMRRAQREEQRQKRHEEKRAQSERAVRRQMLMRQNTMLNQQLQGTKDMSEPTNKKHGKRRRSSRKPPSQTRGSREGLQRRPSVPDALIGTTETGGRHSLVSMLTGAALPAPSISPPPSETGSIRSNRQHPMRLQRSGSLSRPPQHTLSRGELEELMSLSSAGTGRARREKPPHQQRRYKDSNRPEGGAELKRQNSNEGLSPDGETIMKKKESRDLLDDVHPDGRGGRPRRGNSGTTMKFAALHGAEVTPAEFARESLHNPGMAMEVLAEEAFLRGRETWDGLLHRNRSDDGRGVGSSELPAASSTVKPLAQRNRRAAAAAARASDDADSPPREASVIGTTAGGTVGSQTAEQRSQGMDSANKIQSQISKLVHDPEHEIPDDLFQESSTLVADQAKRPDLPMPSTSHRRNRPRGRQEPK